jgi:cytochrome c-type biogenesis protein CcmH
MISFVVLGGLLTLILLVWLVVPLIQKSCAQTKGQADPDTQDVQTLAILRDEQARLDAEHANGEISKAQYHQACLELENRVLDEVVGAASHVDVQKQPPSSRIGVGLVLLGIGLVPWGLYSFLGSPSTLTTRSAVPPSQAIVPFSDEPPSLEADLKGHIRTLEARLQTHSASLDDWEALALAYTALEDFERAHELYQDLAEQAPMTADTLADWADVLATREGGRFEALALQRLDEALAKDPHHIKALTLAGAAAFQAGRPQEAADFWERILAQLDPDSAIAASLAQSIAQARAMAVP